MMKTTGSLELKERKAFYAPAEVARLAGVSSTTLLDWIHSEKLFAVRLSPRIYRIPLASVIGLLYPHMVRRPKIVRGRLTRNAIEADLRRHREEHRRLTARRAVRSAS